MSTDNLFEDTKLLPVKVAMGKECKGLIYRARVNTFINKQGEIVETRRMSQMKSLSCKGCKHCDWILDVVAEDLQEPFPPDFSKLEDQKLYELIYIDEGYQDYEYGWQAEGHSEFIKYKEENEIQ